MKYLLFILVMAGWCDARATSVEKKTLPQLVGDAEHVVTGTVVAVKMHGVLGIELTSPTSRTGPGEINELRWTVSLEPAGVLYSTKEKLPKQIVIKQWQKWHMSLEGAKFHEGQTYVFLLKGDDMQWVYPGLYYRDVSEKDDIIALLANKKLASRFVAFLP